jgi:hypothetical protein
MLANRIFHFTFEYDRRRKIHAAMALAVVISTTAA